jgi:ribosomal protein S18 acetylase RimI-like enzyme
MAAPPNTQTIVRNDDKDSSGIIIESLTKKHFDAARKIENDFLGAGKGLCFGLCPYKCCPMSEKEFEPIYRESPDRCSTYGLAVREEDQLVVGICKLRQRGQPTKWDEDLMHEPAENEMYLDCLAVTKEARGKGVGTKLMKWAEEIARERNATKMALGVTNGNPAKRLYDRAGYVDVHSDCLGASFMLGRPNGQFGAVMMEKALS